MDTKSQKHWIIKEVDGVIWWKILLTNHKGDIKMKHTPGPWWHDGNTISSDIGKTIIYMDKNANLDIDAPSCHIFGSDFDVRKANAKLIATAPDLLNAAIDCIADLEHYVSTHGPGPDKRLIKLKNAIQKATA
jgi:hypothetical protein